MEIEKMTTILEKETNRYKSLPSPDIFKIIKRIITKAGWKMIYIPETAWTHSLTRRKVSVKDIPIIAFAQNSDRPTAITTIQLSIDDDGVFIYTFNKDYQHTNITRDYTTKSYTTSIDDTKYSISIEGHAVCSPITQSHFYTTKEHDLTLIFTGQLTGQNGNSAFRHVDSVAANYMDRPLYPEGASGRSSLIKRKAPVLQLISKARLTDLRAPGGIQRALAGRQLPTDDTRILVKLVHNNCYTCMTRDQYREEIEKDRVSYYYPVISYDVLKTITDNIPKEDIDCACFGLGSAGTAILDQLVRSNFIKSYYLCDFDIVETKNLRNQWYFRTDVNNYKTRASASRIKATKCIDGTSYPPYVITNEAPLEQVTAYTSYKFKYVISAFDSIQTRLNLLDFVKTKKIETDYLIDTRYNNLDSSIFVIDTSNEEEMKYYEDNLLEAFKYFKENDQLSKEEFLDLLPRTALQGNCNELRNAVIRNKPQYCTLGIDCGSDECLHVWEKIYDENKEYVTKSNLSRSFPDLFPSSCIMQNFIDIYKYTATFVFSALRDINNDKPKLFTHIEATTEGLPKHMIVRK